MVIWTFDFFVELRISWNGRNCLSARFSSNANHPHSTRKVLLEGIAPSLPWITTSWQLRTRSDPVRIMVVFVSAYGVEPWLSDNHHNSAQRGVDGQIVCNESAGLCIECKAYSPAHNELSASDTKTNVKRNISLRSIR